MVKNWFTEAMTAWNSMNVKQKLEVFQQTENYAAKLQERRARKIINNSTFGNKAIDGIVVANYSPQFPNYINVVNVNIPFMMAINAIFHEGVHALTDDYIRNLSNIKVLMPIDRKKLNNHIKTRELFYNYFSRTPIMPLYQIKCYEEQMAEKESAMMLFKILCESSLDIGKIASSLDEYFNYILFRLHELDKISRMYQARYKIDYNYEEYRLMNAYSNELNPVSTQKTILDKQDKELIDCFDSVFTLAKKLMNSKDGEESQIVCEILNHCNDYTGVLIQRKIFGGDE